MTTEAETKSKSILIVDDDDQFREMLKRMLELLHFTVLEASSGRQALDLFKQEPADVVITDLVMPEFDGLETIVSFLESFPETRIIAISGGPGGNPKWLPCAEKLGACCTLKKPFTRNDLLSCLEKALV